MFPDVCTNQMGAASSIGPTMDRKGKGMTLYPREVSGTYTLKMCEGCSRRRTMPRRQQYCEACLNPPPKKAKKAKVEPREDGRIKRILSLPGLEAAMERQDVQGTLITEQLRMGQTYIYDLKHGKAKVAPETAQAIADVLCTSVEELQRAS